LSSGFQVILDDLTAAANTFHTEARAFEDIMDGAASPAPVNTGDAELDTTLRAVLDYLVFLHSSIAAWMHDDGDKLQKNRDNYRKVDQSMHELWDDLMADTKHK
jgi:hypothetical protein